MVDYNNFAKTFSESRKNMKWEEIEYFLTSFLFFIENSNILDIGCGNGRFLQALKELFISSKEREGGGINSINYTGIDLSIGLLEEAKKNHPDFKNNFFELNMLDLDSPLFVKEGARRWSHIFFIASFHHLDSYEKRLEVLIKAYNLLEIGGKVFMTNWALNSPLNSDKYKISIIPNSGNSFSSLDYSIKIGEFHRYYHCFDLKELEYLAEKAGFKIIENRLFGNQKNFITILEKIN